MTYETPTLERRSDAIWTPTEIERRVKELGKWFHNLDLRGVQTAPDHFLGDYPRFKFKSFALECLAFLAVWALLSFIQSLIFPISKVQRPTS